MPNLSALLSPKTVAVIGASPDTHILRGRTLKIMLGHDYAGRIYPVSRSHHEVQGLKAYASIADVPEPVDLAVLIIPAQFVPEELERCGQAGVTAALILTSGFAEEQGEAGRDLQQRLRQIAQRYDLTVCGPNTEGFANMAAALCPTFSPAVDGLAAGLVPAWRTSGHVAVVAQSGGMGFAFFDRGRPKEIPFSYVVTTGNEACLESFDVVEHLLDEGRTDVFLLFLENIKNADGFRRVAEKALRAGKPIIIAKIGRSAAGERAAVSHTAAMAGAYDAYQAMFRRYGVIEGTDLEEMVDLAAAFSFYRERLPAGRCVGIGTASGGGGGWAADACAAAGLEIPELDTASRARIDAHLPAYGTSQNPVDGTAQAIREIGYGELARLIGESERVDAVIMVTSARSSETLKRERDKLRQVARATRKPILMWSYTLPSLESVQILSEAGFPLFTNLNSCARALAAMAAYRSARERFLRAPNVAPVAIEPSRVARVREQLASAGPVLCEYQVAPLLREYGIDSGKARLVSSAPQAIAAAAEFATAVALKVQSPDIPHKTEAGAVALDITGAESVRHAYDSVLAKARRYKPQAKIHGVLVQPMAPPGIEMIVGVRRDPLFGPLLMLGMGGIEVELARDFALAPVPLSAEQAEELLGRLRARPRFDGLRGAAPADIPALIDLVVRLSIFAADHAPRIAEIDLNPVIVHPRGGGVSVVDALLAQQPEAG